MLKILGENYYFDIDKIENYVNVEPKPDFTGVSENHISIVKYDLIKILIETLIVETEDADETLGLKNTELSIPFRLAFNSLYYKKLINKI
jgi:hypothetical protein